MQWKTRICDLLGIKYPLLEGAIGILANGELAGAISEAGALGVIGWNPGWTQPEKHLDNLRRHIGLAKARTTRPFGVNVPLMLPPALARRPPEVLGLCAEEGVKVIITSGGSPSIITRQAKDAGFKVLHVVLNCEMARKAEAAGVDAVIATGYEAGGVLGPDELTTVVLVPLVANAVKLPVIGGGGVFDGRGFAAVMALGAEGVQIGTRFIATQECHAHPRFKEAVVKATDTSTIVTRRNKPPLVRSLRTSYTERLRQLDRCGASEETVTAVLGLGRLREAGMEGDLTEGDPICGQAAAGITQILPAGEVVEEIMRQAEEVFARWGKLSRQ